MSGRYETLIQQSDDPYGPADKPMLRVSVCGPDVFLTIVDYDETHDTTTLKDRESVMVPIYDLCRALFGGTPVDPIHTADERKERDS